LEALKYTPSERRYLVAKGALSEATVPINQFMWGVYMTLRGKREWGANGPCPISLSSIVSYCDLAYIDERAQRVRLMRFITALDEVELGNYGNGSSKA
jgi:hypothetical protein